MSKITDLYMHVTENPDVATRLQNLVQTFPQQAELTSEQQEQIIDDLIVFAKEEGYLFTREEVYGYLTSTMENGEISEDELDAVAGGKGSGDVGSGNGCNNTKGACLVVGGAIKVCVIGG